MPHHFKVRARWGEVVKVIELERGVSYAEFKSKVEGSFGGKTLVIKTDKQAPLYQDIHLKDALKELERTGGKFLSLSVSGEGPPPSLPAGAIPARSSAPAPTSPSSFSSHSPSSAPVSSAGARPSPVASSGGDNRCTACLNSISGQGLRAVGGLYHQECFVCSVCHNSLMDGMFNLHEGKLYCAADFLAVAADKCTSCHQAITSAFLNISGSKYHPECFVCIECGKPFSGSYTTKNGKPVHASCLVT